MGLTIENPLLEWSQDRGEKHQAMNIAHQSMGSSYYFGFFYFFAGRGLPMG